MNIKTAVMLGAACAISIPSSLTLAQAGVPHSEAQGAVLKSQHSIDLSLAEAVALGLRRNYSIRSLKLQRVREKFELRVVDNMFNPKLKLTGTYTFARGSSDRSRASDLTPSVSVQGEYGTSLDLSWNQQLNATKNSGDLSREGLGLTLTQPLLRGAGKEVTTAPLRLAKLTEQVNQLNVQASVSQTIYEIIAAYRTLMKSQNQVTLATEALKRAVALLEVNQLLIVAGRVAQFDVIQIEADIATQELAVEEAKNQLQASRLQLLKLLALDLATPVLASDTLHVTPLEIDQGTALQMAQAKQPQYLATLLQSEQAAINLLVAQDRARWDVSWVAGVNQQRDQHSINGSSRAWDSYTGLKLEIPIGDMSIRQGQVNARSMLEQQQLLQEEARIDLQRQITDAVRGLNTLWRQLGISQRVMDLSRRKLAIEHDKLNAGRSSNFQIISFEADLRAAEDADLSAQISYLDARAQLDLLLGVMLENWEISLERF
ncbi:TolC family protein [Pseudomonas sp. DSV-1]|nr:TolC family protein [Pseudomonas sp. DSV-1]MEC4238026.1 TolC family protein [Pseudomonas sp. DSV-1]